jgi:hypothetical protein
MKSMYLIIYSKLLCLPLCVVASWLIKPVRPKTRGLAQSGGPPGWLEESDLAGVILYLMDGQTACLFHTIPVALTGAAQLQADRISSCSYIVNIHNHPS